MNRSSQLTAISAALAFLSLGPALAQSGDEEVQIEPLKPIEEAQSGDRYQLEKVEGGYLRFDRETGASSFCTLNGSSFVCTIGADERLAYQEALSALEARVAALEAAEAGTKNEASALPSQDELSQNQIGSELEELTPKPPKELTLKDPEPSAIEKQLDEALDFAGEAMKKLIETVEELKQDYSDRNQEAQ